MRLRANAETGALWLVSAVLALGLFACGKGLAPFSNSSGGSGGGETQITAPSNLTYSTNPATYQVGPAIVANVASSQGGPVQSYSVSPSFPSGLSFSTSTGTLTGSPLFITATSTYTVTATNTAGSTNADLVLSSFSTYSGMMGFQSVVNDTDPGVNGLSGAREFSFSSDGAYVYVAADGDDSVTWFSRNSTSGALSFLGIARDGVSGVDGLNGAFQVVLSPDDNFAYVVATVDNAVTTFSRSSATGALTYLGTIKDSDPGIDGLNFATNLVISPDGNHLYVSGALDNGIAMFSRNTSTGALTFLGAIKDSDPGVDGLQGAENMAFDPTGTHLYVCGNQESKVAVLTRNPSTGALTFSSVIRDSDPGVDGLDLPGGISISPDGRFVYVTANNDDSIAAFSRNSSTGALTFLQVIKNTDPGVSGLNLAETHVMSPDANNLYVASTTSNALVSFSRNATTGLLTFVEAEVDGSGGVSGMAGAFGVGVSPEGRHVYCTGSTGNAIDVFTRN